MASTTIENYGMGDEKIGTSDEKYGTSNEQREVEASEDDPMDIDLAIERRALRKVDWHLLPMVFLLYMFAFID
ncbi:MAG: hypothetical protein Q9226_008149, partial [Calogaya cf. arnoldii]